MSARGGIAEDRAANGTSRWPDAWIGEGLRREVFFFRSGDERLYGSLYAATEISRPFGVVACNSWGVEADRCDPLLRSLTLAMARLGGAGMVFHYPGYGDSYGDLAGLRLADLSGAASDAVAEASRRCPGLSWILAGFMLGASVACLAQGKSAARALLLVQPALRPGAYFERLAEDRRPLAPGPSPREMMMAGTRPGMAYGYPVPQRIVERAVDGDLEVDAALAAFEGDGAVVRHEKPSLAKTPPERFEQVVVPGTWRFGSLNHPKLSRAAAEWLERRTSNRES